MGLTHTSTGLGAVDGGLTVMRRSPSDRVIALAGNPNVGKSTLFNALTGLHQHTGNWPGKTVANAQGYCERRGQGYVLVDLPGTYSLLAHSAEEEVARDFLCFGGADAVAVVCDATCLERNLNLVLQTLELNPRAVVCVNLMDEARRKGIHIDLSLLSQRLGVPVIGTVGRKKRSLHTLLDALDQVAEGATPTPPPLRYPKRMETAIAALEPLLAPHCAGRLSPRWLALKLLEGDESLATSASAFLGVELMEDQALAACLSAQRSELASWGFDADRIRDFMVSALLSAARRLCRGVVTFDREAYDHTDRALDRLLTSRATGYPIMVALLAGIFWLTIVGANYPSQLLSQALFWFQDRLTDLFTALHAPDWLHGALVLGVYRVLAWVVSVMLPPMAIFFPLFTLLEDVGYLPRIAYDLDKPFRSCGACGKQALTTAMGFGCNAAGVVGCRIIDSPRERLLAVLTNSFVPCNGRFPTLIAILTMFFVGTVGGLGASVRSALLLTGVILLGVGLTFIATRLLSATVLKGMPSSFTLELPPYRKPQVGKVIVRSIFDRTLFVLGRAAAVAAPAGLLIWVMANVTVGEATLLAHCAGALDPFARLLGLDGVILMAFILGFPANEIVIPIILMAYLAQGSLLELGSLESMRQLFLANGWTTLTAVNVMLFSLLHWPCSTTLLTIHKETGSWKWTALAAALPTAFGVVLCALTTALAGAWGL